MYKKISTIVTLFFVFLLMFSPNVISNENAENKSSNIFGFRSLFASHPLIYILHERTDEMAIPNSGVLEIPLEITFDLIGLFAHRHERRFRNRVIGVKLSIDEKPDWCEADLSDDLVNFRIGQSEPYQSSLLVTVNEMAPAFSQGVVKIRAKSDEIRGLFLIKVREGEETFSIPFVIGYWPAFSYKLHEGTLMEIPPLNNTIIPIKLENLGNGPTWMNIEVIDIPKNWNLDYPKNITLGSLASNEENKGEIKITIRSPKDFSVETIRIKLTPSYVGRPGLSGQSEIITLTLKNDGSLKEEEGSDITFLITIIVTIVLIILVSIFLIRKYLKK
ncbi:MAG: hypothetical protein JSW62_05060 [Thermoplasmatales archaeon]|nr:MAG: hypothetical protein JSW62_05060 [Thermoplasmatales archaeon]